MIQFTNPTFDQITPLAFLPPAPAAEFAPPFGDDPAVQQIHRELAALHCAAFVALYGTPPQFVSLTQMTIQSNGGPSQPVIAARLQSKKDPRSVDWFNAFRAGLTTWEEASFTDPITAIPSDGLEEGDLLDLSITTFDDAVRAACRRMVRIGQTSALRNLIAFCDGQLPSRYDPDHPDFPIFRPPH